MATNMTVWVGNAYGHQEPLIMLGAFQAGSTQAIKRGEILSLTGDSNTKWEPISSDLSAAANLAIAACEIKAGDRAGYYPIMVPRPGDIFEYPVATAAATAVGTAMTYSTSQQLTTGGTYAILYACGQEHYPLEQGHLADDAGPDRGTTIKSSGYVRGMMRLAASYFAAFNK